MSSFHLRKGEKLEQIIISNQMLFIFRVNIILAALRSVDIHSFFREGSNKKKKKFGHMPKLGLPYLPRTLIWTKIVWANVFLLPYLPSQLVWTFLDAKQSLAPLI